MTRGAPPPIEVLEAFELRGNPAPLSGGQGTAWRVDDVVLKPGTDPSLQAWLGTELAAIDQIGFALPDVLQGRDGRWVVDGWAATTWMQGVSAETHEVDWLTVVEAGRAFHRAARDVPRPDWLADRSSWWVRADQAAWGEDPMDVVPPLQGLVFRLTDALAPLGPDQMVHADLTGNVLVSDDRPPAIIDVSPYWRPSAYAEGVVIADAICWHGASAQLAHDAGVDLAAVARGLLFRVLATNAMQQDRPNPSALARDLEHYADAANSLEL